MEPRKKPTANTPPDVNWDSASIRLEFSSMFQASGEASTSPVTQVLVTSGEQLKPFIVHPTDPLLCTFWFNENTTTLKCNPPICEAFAVNFVLVEHQHALQQWAAADPVEHYSPFWLFIILVKIGRVNWTGTALGVPLIYDIEEHGRFRLHPHALFMLACILEYHTGVLPSPYRAEALFAIYFGQPSAEGRYADPNGYLSGARPLAKVMHAAAVKIPRVKTFLESTVDPLVLSRCGRAHLLIAARQVMRPEETLNVQQATMEEDRSLNASAKP